MHKKYIQKDYRMELIIRKKTFGEATPKSLTTFLSTITSNYHLQQRFMCRVSEKIKFCTCSAPSIDSLKHYWVFYRKVKGKDIMVMGEPMSPYPINIADDQHNRNLLKLRVNEPDAFDIDLQPKTGDRLQVSFQCANAVEGYLHYGFKFEKGKWIEKEFDYFDWMTHHEEDKFGKLNPALDAKRTKEANTK